jgi:hypothetical protein
MSTPRAIEIIAAQPALQPGTEGYWKVWGASVRDITPGDLVILKYSDGEVCEYEVSAYVPRVERGNTVSDDLAARGHTGGGIHYDQLRPTDGELFTVGALQRIVLLRKSTHNILSEYVR